MKTHPFFHKSRLLPWLGVVAMVLPGLGRAIEPATSAPPRPPADQEWPRDITSGKVRITCYQPQIDEWTGYRVLHARFAVALTPPGEAPQLGVAEITGETTSDQETRTVVIRNLKITGARFQTGKPEDSPRLEALLKQSFPSAPVTASLDHMLAGVKLAKGAAHTAEVKMDPPPIFISMEPAMLLMVEGKPVLAPIDKSPLKIVVNTNLENKDTDYQNGILSDLEAAVIQRIPDGMGLGLVGSWIEQLTDDDGTTADTLNGFSGRAFGIGPILTYTKKFGDSQLDLNARWIHEFEVEKRFSGDVFSLSAGYKF